MTLVNTETGELVDVLSKEEAERLSTRISLRLEAIADNHTAVMPMIREAIERQAHLALGYASPGAYVRDRFGESLAKLGVEMKATVVRELERAGLSSRAIAPVVGLSDRRIRQLTSGGNDFPPETEIPHVVVAGESPEFARPSVVDPAPRPAVVGIDGKTYTQVRRARQEQRPDAEVTLNVIEADARKAATAAGNLTAAQIDRVKPNAALWVGGIRESVEALQRLLTSLESENQ